MLQTTGRLGARLSSGTPIARAAVRPSTTHNCGRVGTAATSCVRSAARDVAAPAPAAAAVISDTAVPEGHRELHGFLYGDGDADAHSASTYDFRPGEDDGGVLIQVALYLEGRGGEKPPGVFAIYDAQRVLQYISFSRNIVLAIKAVLARVGPDRCAFVRIMVFANAAMATRSHLERQAANWLAEAGELPPGNSAEAADWSGLGSTTSALTPKEFEEYENKKLKMRKAMGENLHDDVDGETMDARTRRINLIRAVESDNWSAVIQEQTDEALGVQGTQAALAQAAVASGAVVSPFTSASVHRSIGEQSVDGDSPRLELTVETVDVALEEVRPYLMADGGNVEVVAVRDGVVQLRLQGACGTCASSAATMKMGIERALRARFGGQLRDVVQVDRQDPSATVASVNAHLDMLRPAIQNLGGSVEVEAVEGGVCSIRYSGPAPLARGIEAAVRDRFPDLSEVQVQIDG